MTDIVNICGIDCYEKDGVVYLRLETAARGLGFTKTETKNGVQYTTVRWERVFRFLDEIGFDHLWSKDIFIPENVFYRLAMKAKNEVAENFQALIADKVIPEIRRTGTYSVDKPKVAPLQPESAGGVARLITVLRSTMKDNGQPPEIISRMVKGLCDQLGIVLPTDFVRVSSFEQLRFPVFNAEQPRPAEQREGT